MSSNTSSSPPLRWLLSLLCIACMHSAADAQASDSIPLSCPASIQVTSAAAPIAGWQSTGVEEKYTLAKTSIFNVDKPGGQEYELAPDQTTQHSQHVVEIWHLDGYRTMKIYLRCFFKNTQVATTREIPAGIQSCQLDFDLDKLAHVSGAPHISCK